LAAGAAAAERRNWINLDTNAVLNGGSYTISSNIFSANAQSLFAQFQSPSDKPLRSFGCSCKALDGHMPWQWLQQNSVTVVVILVMAAVFVPISVVHILAAYVFR